MTVIVVANPKGDVGKSALSTNLAGYFAEQGAWAALADLNRQQSSHGWLALPPTTLPGNRLDLANKVIVPLQPSMFDIPTQQCLERLASERAVRKVVVQVGMRVDARTRSAKQLQRFVEGLELPVFGYLRDTQNYVQVAAHGLTLWNVVKSRVEKDFKRSGSRSSTGRRPSRARPIKADKADKPAD